MKMLKNLLYFIVLIPINTIDARPMGAPTPAKQPIPAPRAAQVQPKPTSALPGRSFQYYFQEVRRKPAKEVINEQGVFADSFITFVQSSNLAPDFQLALFEAGRNLHLPLSGNNQEDAQKLAQAMKQVSQLTGKPVVTEETRPTQPIDRPSTPYIEPITMTLGKITSGANYRNFMRGFNQSPLRTDGTVNPAWIEGAAVALRADGYNTIDAVTNAMTQIVTDAVNTSPFPRIKNNLNFTLQSFNDSWKEIQTKGIGIQYTMDLGKITSGVNYRKFMRGFNQSPLRTDGTVNPAWIEGAALALREDGYNTMDAVTNAMTQIITDAVTTSPFPRIKNNLNFTLQSFNDSWKKIQTKGIGEETVTPEEQPIWGKSPLSDYTENLVGARLSRIRSNFFNQTKDNRGATQYQFRLKPGMFDEIKDLIQLLYSQYENISQEEATALILDAIQKLITPITNPQDLRDFIARSVKISWGMEKISKPATGKIPSQQPGQPVQMPERNIFTSASRLIEEYGDSIPTRMFKKDAQGQFQFTPNYPDIQDLDDALLHEYPDASERGRINALANAFSFAIAMKELEVKGKDLEESIENAIKQKPAKEKVEVLKPKESPLEESALRIVKNNWEQITSDILTEVSPGKFNTYKGSVEGKAIRALAKLIKGENQDASSALIAEALHKAFVKHLDELQIQLKTNEISALLQYMKDVIQHNWNNL